MRKILAITISIACVICLMSAGCKKSAAPSAGPAKSPATAAAQGQTEPEQQQVQPVDGPPTIVATVPANRDMNVDPNLKEISVTYNKDMTTYQSWSFVMTSQENFPRMDNAGIRYLEDKRTCVAPVTLEPGKEYEIWFNSDQFKNFKGVDGTPAPPFLLKFKTRE